MSDLRGEAGSVPFAFDAPSSTARVDAPVGAPVPSVVPKRVVGPCSDCRGTDYRLRRHAVWGDEWLCVACWPPVGGAEAWRRECDGEGQR